MQDFNSTEDAEEFVGETLEETLEHVGQRLGFYQELGPDHMAVFAENGGTIFDDEPTVLLVSFVLARDDDATLEDVCPLGCHLRKKHGWAHLCVVATAEKWFRDPAVYAFFDQLVDDAFFEHYDRVIFFGERMCGYAAAAFSVAAPGAHVLAFSPQATLNPAVAGWDTRYPRARLLDFTERFGYAPEMAEAADKVYVIYDPYERLDAMHAALFSGNFAMHLPIRFHGADTAEELDTSGVLPELVEAAAGDGLDRTLFYRLMRKRRYVRRYLRRVLAETQNRRRPYLTAMTARTILTYRVGPQIKEAYTTALTKLEKEGRTLPDLQPHPASAKAAQG